MNRESSIKTSYSFKVYTYLLFFIWPIASLILSFRDYKQEWSKNILWIFCVFFGYAFIISEIGGADSDRYARWFLQYVNSDLNLSDLFKMFYSQGSRYLDIASPLISFIVSRFTSNPSVLFAVFGFIFGFFYSRNIWLILESLEGKITFIVIIFIVSFALINPIWNINGFRMWTAAQIFLYGTLPYLLFGKSKNLIWSIISIFFHFSFLLPVIILFMFIFLQNRLHLFFWFFIITAFIKEIDLLSIQSFLYNYLPDIFHSKIAGYTNPQYAESLESMNQSLNWYIPFSRNAIKWIVYGHVIYIYLFFKEQLFENKDYLALLCFSLLFYGTANIVSFVPSGHRFVTVANTFMLPFLILFLNHFSKIKNLNVIKYLSAPFLIVFCVVMIRVGMDHYGLLTLIGNPILVVFDSDQIRLIEEVKKIF